MRDQEGPRGTITLHEIVQGPYTQIMVSKWNHTYKDVSNLKRWIEKIFQIMFLLGKNA